MRHPMGLALPPSPSAPCVSSLGALLIPVAAGRWETTPALPCRLGLGQQPSNSCFSGWLQSWGVALPHFVLVFLFLFFFHLEQKQLSQGETYCGLVACRQLHLHDTEGQQGVCPPSDGGPWLTVVASSPQISPSGISMAPAPSKPKAPTVTCTCDLLPCFGTLFARIPTN